jgi:hypothetical protein
MGKTVPAGLSWQEFTLSKLGRCAMFQAPPTDQGGELLIILLNYTPWHKTPLGYCKASRC